MPRIPFEGLTPDDIKNILALINKATISGTEALTVALLQEKLTKMLTPVEGIMEEAVPAKEEKKKK